MTDSMVLGANEILHRALGAVQGGELIQAGCGLQVEPHVYSRSIAKIILAKRCDDCLQTEGLSIDDLMEMELL